MGQRGGGSGSGSKSQGRTEIPGETGCPAGEQQQGCGQVPRTKQQETAGEPCTCSTKGDNEGPLLARDVSSRLTCVPLKDMQHELELLTKELRQVNLQQFIKQTGTKVTVLPAEPGEDEGSNSSQTSQTKGNISFILTSNGWIQ